MKSKLDSETLHSESCHLIGNVLIDVIGISEEGVVIVLDNRLWSAS